ncbi:MAG: anaerobic ribonucleoside-triphosphate reductase activating protein [Nitrososphaerota archaeon]|nr:anaerobic ribonucleoside-triphosphate reductase activating protein [Candidatus Bathyarchaeota archaeon]MDW8048552.1 anaerobic ribonucleoside-triphosphate reductase activating protein [Nitrososphaerota archaeon]
MRFGGLQKTSLIDFPGRISSILFTVGCNLRCPFCYNWRLIIDPKPPFLSEDEALEILESRRKYIDAVVISGGEPTINSDLPDFVRRLKERGFSVKLDTNGFRPEILEECLPNLDYVSLDVKTSKDKYGILGVEDVQPLLRSLEILKKGDVDYEFRNTVVPRLVDREDVLKMGEMVRGGKRFVFQQFLPENAWDHSYREINPYDESVIMHFADLIRPYVEEVQLRV